MRIEVTTLTCVHQIMATIYLTESTILSGTRETLCHHQSKVYVDSNETEDEEGDELFYDNDEDMDNEDTDEEL